MRIHHIKRICSRPLFMIWGKHFCSDCGETLRKVKISKIVNSQSEEARDYDFSSPGGYGYLIGNVKFIWTELSCDRCKRNFSTNEIYQAEKQAKKADKK